MRLEQGQAGGLFVRLTAHNTRVPSYLDAYGEGGGGGAAAKQASLRVRNLLPKHVQLWGPVGRYTVW